jgi:xanthine dehydrogenase accessory factor
MADIYQEILENKNKGEDAALVTIISTAGSTPREVGAKMLVKADGTVVGTVGGGSLEFLATNEAIKAIQTGKSKRIDYSLQPGGDTDMTCGGDAEIFIEPILSLPSLYIFGGGHIGLALTKMGKLCGFKVIVIDDRPEYANAERFPEADRTVVSEYKDAFAAVKVDRSGYIVIVTHGHKGDAVALEGALATSAPYIGMIGSKKKVAATYNRLVEKGIPREELNRVHSPIGLDIYAQTPEEIAVSIMAEIISIRRGPRG